MTITDMFEQEVVIAGLSGRFPECDNVAEFREKLFAGEDMVTEDDRRWKPGAHGLPKRNGKLKEIDKFDAEFFGIGAEEADKMDPQFRILLEVAYEAIVDSGTDVKSVSGSNTGVFLGISNIDALFMNSDDTEPPDGSVITGSRLSMAASRICNYFNFTGPSSCLDTGCSAAMIALNNALVAMRKGDCDAAIVGYTNMLLLPSISVTFNNLSMLAADGTCRSFDEAGAGYVRSESVVAVYLQKAPDARRVYASLVHAGANSNGYNEKGIAFPSGEMQKRLLKQVYAQCGVDPLDVSYVEAHGTGTPAGDPQELSGIVDVFCPSNRKEPLLLGSTKSNMGHSEPTAGLCSLAKVLIAIQEKRIPKNLHFNKPNPGIPALFDGRVRVVDEVMPLCGEYVAINSFGFGGANTHVVLKHNPAEKKNLHPSAEDLRLFTYSGRTEEGVEKVLAETRSKGSDVSMQALLQANANTRDHTYRGYTLLNETNPTSNIQAVGTRRRKVWWVFSGMGAQWPGMARDLMPLPVFRHALEQCSHALKPLGLDLMSILMNNTEDTYTSIINSFVAVTAVQVALVDMLRCVGIEPDGIMGHSVGEIAAAYADGALTRQETVLTAYSIAHACMKGVHEAGGMAAVGLTWDEAVRRCPDGVIPACYNARDNVTVSGPFSKIQKFTEELAKEDIFAKIVDSSGMAFHSDAIKRVAPAMQKGLEQVIKENRPWTKRWISTSVPEEEWDSALASSCSAEYFVNNMHSPVMFYDALLNVDANACVVEIGPHGVLQSILRRALQGTHTVAALLTKTKSSPQHFLAALGELYVSGLDMDPMALYAPVQFPVAVETPMLSSLVEWDHSTTRMVPLSSAMKEQGTGATEGRMFNIDISRGSSDNYLKDHKIDGRVLYPAAGYIVLVWQTYAEILGVPFEELAIAMEEAHVYEATMLSENSPVTFVVTIAPGTGAFEVRRTDGSVTAAGRIRRLDEDIRLRKQTIDQWNKVSYEDSADIDSRLVLKDLYTEMRVMGFHFGPEFKNILAIDEADSTGLVKWSGRWVTFLDSLLQMTILRTLRYKVPTSFHSIKIDPRPLLATTAPEMPVEIDFTMNRFVSEGVEIMNPRLSTASRRKYPYTPRLQRYRFLPYHQTVALPGGEDYVQQCKAYIKTGIEQLRAKTDDNALQNSMRALIAMSDMEAKTPQPINDASQQDGDSNEAETEESHALLGFLKELFTLNEERDLSESLSTLASAKDDIYSNDQILGCLKQPEFIRSFFATVTDNRDEVGTVQKLRIAEFGTGEFYKHIVRLYEESQLIFEYTVVRNDDDVPDDLQELVENGSVTVLHWDPTKPAPEELKSSDWLILDQVAFDNRFATDMATLYDCVRERGWVMLHGATANHSLALAAHLLLKSSSDIEKIQHNSKCFFNEREVIDIVTASNLHLVSKISSVLNTLFLCRKLEQQRSPSDDVVIDITSTEPEWVPDLKNALDKEHVTWLTTSNTQSGIIAMTKSLRCEQGGNTLRCMSYDEGAVHESFIARQRRLDLSVNVYRDHTWGHYVCLPVDNKKHAVKQCKPAYVNVGKSGDLASLQWIESSLQYFSKSLTPDLELCHVHYAALNFRDIMLATGKLPPEAIPGDLSMEDCMLGMEFSGTDSTGRRVMGMTDAKALATSVAVKRKFLWEVPSTWSLEEAATVPVVHCTAYYALVVRGGIQRGHTVLIHSGSGGVGQAAIAIALSMQCTVYTTVGTQKKIDYLKKKFPQLQDSNFANSRDASFETHIMERTSGRGCDLVLNSLAGDLLQASLRCLAKRGRFLEIGKYDLARNTSLGMSLLMRNVTIHGILMDALFEEDAGREGVATRVYELLEQGIREGVVKPLQATVFDKAEIEAGFRFMAQGKHIGKVLIKVENEGSNSVEDIASIQRAYFDPGKTYIVLGGLGGFGLQMCGWLIDRGATNLLLTSRSGIKTGYQRRMMRRWNARPGVNVMVSINDVTSYDKAEELIQLAQQTAPVGGVFNLAAVLIDSLMDDQNVDNFHKVLKPKVDATMHLDTATRKFCTDSLEYFVCFSTRAVCQGCAGQVNYTYANSYMERLCDARHRDGLPALAIQWGPIGDVGVATDLFGDNDMVLQGCRLQPIASCFEYIDQLLNQSEPVVSCFVIAERLSVAKGVNRVETVLSSIAHILGISNIKDVNRDMTLTGLGVDSLMSTEVKQALDTSLDTVIPFNEVGTLTFKRITEMLTESDKKTKDSANGDDDDPSADPPTEGTNSNEAVSPSSTDNH